MVCRFVILSSNVKYDWKRDEYFDMYFITLQHEVMWFTAVDSTWRSLVHLFRLEEQDRIDPL